MTDPVALRSLATGYAAAVDALDAEGFAALFTPDGELWVPDVNRDSEPTVCRRGTEALASIPPGLSRYHATHHGVGAAAYAVDGDAATGTVAGVAHHLTAVGGADGGGVDTVWYLTYEDDYRRTGEEWRIARRILRLREVEERRCSHLGPGRGPAVPERGGRAGAYAPRP